MPKIEYPGQACGVYSGKLQLALDFATLHQGKVTGSPRVRELPAYQIRTLGTRHSTVML